MAALLGWLFNKLLLNFFLNRIVPKLQPGIADGLARFAVNNIDLEKIAAGIAADKNLQPLYPKIEQHLDNLLRNKIQDKVPMLAMLLGDKTIDKIKSSIMEELQVALPKLVMQLGTNVKMNTQMESLVRSKILDMDFRLHIARLKTGLKKPLAYFQFAGALSGFLIGLALMILSIICK